MHSCGVKTVVCPTRYNQVNTCSQSQVNYVHPTHTAVMNHHLVKNVHYYPHTTSYHNRVSHVNLQGGAYPPPAAPMAPRPRW